MTELTYEQRVRLHECEVAFKWIKWALTHDFLLVRDFIRGRVDEMAGFIWLDRNK